MQIVPNASSTFRIVLEPNKERRRKLQQLFYKYAGEDITMIPTMEYEMLVKERDRLVSQLKMINEMRQAELDRKDVHRRV